MASRSTGAGAIDPVSVAVAARWREPVATARARVVGVALWGWAGGLVVIGYAAGSWVEQLTRACLEGLGFVNCWKLVSV